MNLDEFATRLNSDIVGKLVNIASRCAGFITKNAAGNLASALPDPDLHAQFAAAGDSIASAFEACDTASAVRDIMSLADRANQYIDLHKPWTLAKQAGRAAEVQGICTQGLNLFRVLMIYLQPVLPDMAAKARQFFHESSWTWARRRDTPAGYGDIRLRAAGDAPGPQGGRTSRGTGRRRPSAAASTIAASSAATPPSAAGASAAAASSAAASSTAASIAASSTAKVRSAARAAPSAATAAPPAAAASAASPAGSRSAPPAPARGNAPGGVSDTAALAAAAAVEGNIISIDDFLRVDLRVAKVLNAELVNGADKLLKLRIDVGDLGERIILAGIRAAYDPAALGGPPDRGRRKPGAAQNAIRTSEGMMLAAGPGGKDIFVLSPDTGGRLPACASSEMIGQTAPDIVARIDALLPQTQCTRCGYAGCAPLRRGDRERRGTDQPVPSRRQSDDPGLGAAVGPARATPESRPWRGNRASRRVDR